MNPHLSIAERQQARARWANQQRLCERSFGDRGRYTWQTCAVAGWSNQSCRPITLTQPTGKTLK